MKLNLLSRQELTSFTLPKKLAGQYFIRGKNDAGKMTNIVAVEANRPEEIDGALFWTLKSNRRYKIVDKNNNAVLSVNLNSHELHRIQSADGSQKFVLYTEPTSSDRRQYTGYEITKQQIKLRIGRGSDNHIVYSNSFVSGSHAELTISQGRISIRDLGSTNNTYVNGQAVVQEDLSNGDVVYILGFQIIVFSCYIFINNPDENVELRTGDLRKLRTTTSGTSTDEEHDYEDAPDDYFFRSPRFKTDVDTFELKIDAPPTIQNPDEVPMIMLIGPSMTMGMAAIAMGSFAVINAIDRGDITAAIPAIVMSISMLLGTMMWPIITKRHQRKLAKKNESRRQAAYLKYLQRMEEVIAKEIWRQENVMRSNDVSTTTYANRILQNPPQIWERTPKHTDFLTLRLGNGKLTLNAEIKFSDRKFTVESDNLEEEMYNFGEKKRWLTNVPIRLPLAKKFISGVYGDKSIIFSYAKSLILQIVALHSYDEVKIALVYDESAADGFAFTRYLPHTMNNERTERYIATNSDEAKELSASLDKIVEQRKQLDEISLIDESPHYVIICLDKELALKTEIVRRILAHKQNLRFSVLSMFERLKDIPKEASAVVEIKEGNIGKLTYIGDVSEPPIPFNTDTPQPIDIRQITKVIANTVVDVSGTSFILPKKYTFFELLDVGMIEHLNLMDNWSANDPTKSLAATIGIDMYGEPFKLDLHEWAHGPHGLVAGMTGSGKSEFIIAYILSMAVSFHPYEVAFILIDYKGGGMAESFKNIPHTAGVITNLDGNQIKRSLASMRSELHRRERIFLETSKYHNVSNIDIYKYQKLYRDGKVDEPLPHLFIISDEFAELKKEQPDFMSELSSTARVGRSLGVHLILATQKPGGVVDDQIRSNSRLRICLKVQDTGDSNEMLGRNEAASLVDTGRFYMQVGNNEIFEMGQSAWAGAPYYPSSKVVKDLDDAISVINTNGRVIAEKNNDRFSTFKDPQKQLDVVTNYIKRICEEEKIERFRMWLDPIPAIIFVDELTKKYAGTGHNSFILNPIIGEYDNPAHQSQGLLRIPISSDGNVVVYGSAGSGKAMFIEALCFSIMQNHSPSEVNIYILDFDAETLTSFSQAPHIGDVLLSYETEKVNNLMKMLQEEVDSRKKMLADFGGNFSQYNKQAKNPKPNLLIIINNYAIFAELYDHLQADIGFLSREGTKYGLYFVLACTAVGDLRYTMMQNFRSTYCLQLNNSDDYFSVVGSSNSLLPEKFKGRGIYRPDKDHLFEFQIAQITKDEMTTGFIRQFSKEMAEKYLDYQAASIPILPDVVTGVFLRPHIEKISLRRVPIGVEKETLDIAFHNFEAEAVHLVLSLNQEWQDFTENLGVMLAKYANIKTMIMSPEGHAKEYTEAKSLSIFSTVDDCRKAINEIALTVKSREEDSRAVHDPMFIIIQSYASLKTVIERSEDGSTLITRLQSAMEKSGRNINIHFVIAESFGQLTSFAGESWYREHIDGNKGIWIGSGISTQYRLNISKIPPDYTAELEPDFGFLIAKAAATQVKFISGGVEE